jgi:hypothetical protein
MKRMCNIFASSRQTLGIMRFIYLSNTFAVDQAYRTAESTYVFWHWIRIIIQFTQPCLLLGSDLLFKLIFPGILPHPHFIFCICWANSNLIYFRARNVPLLRQKASTSQTGKPIEIRRKTWKCSFRSGWSNAVSEYKSSKTGCPGTEKYVFNTATPCGLWSLHLFKPGFYVFDEICPVLRF